MEEYFEVFASDFGSFFEIFIPWALEIAMIMIVLEIVLGVAVLLLYRMEITHVGAPAVNDLLHVPHRVLCSTQ
ncbi:MAG: hypothetical protein WDO15_16130 [Bacteroidota bacterium]